MYDLSTRMKEAITEELQACLDEYIKRVPIRIIIDGMEMEPEECGIDVSRHGGELNIIMNLGIKRMIQRNPEEYKRDLHYPLFTGEERINLSMSMR